MRPASSGVASMWPWAGARLEALRLQRPVQVGEQVGVGPRVGQRLGRLGVDLGQVLAPQLHHLRAAPRLITSAPALMGFACKAWRGGWSHTLPGRALLQGTAARQRGASVARADTYGSSAGPTRCP